MNERPLSVTILSVVLIATGAFGLIFHLRESTAQRAFDYGIVWISFVRLIAIVCGVYMLRGRNWARLLSLAWISFHVILSIFHSLVELGLHVAVWAVFAYFLFRPRASAYFRGADRTL